MKRYSLVSAIGLVIIGVLTFTNGAAAFESEIISEDSIEPEYVHQVPPCPVIIDGIEYKAEEIHTFDGQRLWFTADENDVLYAFTTEKAIDAFHDEQIKLLAEKNSGVLASKGYSYFFEDINYGGSSLSAPPGSSYASLGSLDDEITSFQLDAGIYKASLYENTSYGGDVFERVGGTSISTLWIFGWNDRASSLKVIE